ncbi:dephospho-CoA kinase [Helicobacter sp. 11S03491-1]|uniref:dephospho-CoA kinase n=1 Tax=Helicobacter sp. 11S03491-1 TaxID=1476196 RepID=UPI000BA6E6B5|nr:dephospho-CoA kinase [Helicobacter sp. 11S03491-1]PAF41881.1 dephospho-CoA kinase [Helicobacter sp. 11S03491-1]
MKLHYGIVLTGGIACGKSTISSILLMYGYTVIDADKIAHQVLNKNKNSVLKLFGEDKDILTITGEIDRKKLGKIVFNDVSSRKKLENLLHPKIRQEIFTLAEKLESHQQYYFLDIPLFFEIGGRLVYQAHKVLLAYIPKEIQVQRIVKRDFIDSKEALKRIQAQIDIEEKRIQSDVVIENTGGLKELQKKVEDFLETLS